MSVIPQAKKTAVMFKLHPLQSSRMSFKLPGIQQMATVKAVICNCEDLPRRSSESHMLTRTCLPEKLDFFFF